VNGEKNGVISKLSVEVEVVEVESSLPYGLRVQWAKGNRGRESFNVTCGAGVGSPWIIFEKTSKGKTRTVVLNVSKLIESIDEVLE
jgi:hypothetical protein